MSASRTSSVNACIFGRPRRASSVWACKPELYQPTLRISPSPLSSVTGVDMLLSDVAMGQQRLIKMAAIARVFVCIFLILWYIVYVFSIASVSFGLFWSSLVCFWYLLDSADILSSPLLSFGLFRITSGHFGSFRVTGDPSPVVGSLRGTLEYFG